MEYCYHVWTGAPICYLNKLDALKKQIYKIVGPALTASLESLTYRRNVASLSLFHRYYFGKFLSELTEIPFQVLQNVLYVKINPLKV